MQSSHAAGTDPVASWLCSSVGDYRDLDQEDDEWGPVRDPDGCAELVVSVLGGIILGGALRRVWIRPTQGPSPRLGV